MSALKSAAAPKRRCRCGFMGNSVGWISFVVGSLVGPAFPRTPAAVSPPPWFRVVGLWVGSVAGRWEGSPIRQPGSDVLGWGLPRLGSTAIEGALLLLRRAVQASPGSRWARGSSLRRWRWAEADGNPLGQCTRKVQEWSDSSLNAPFDIRSIYIVQVEIRAFFRKRQFSS